MGLFAAKSRIAPSHTLPDMFDNSKGFDLFELSEGFFDSLLWQSHEKKEKCVFSSAGFASMPFTFLCRALLPSGFP